MKTLVLGATGIIGNHIVRELLHQGHDVSALSRGVTSSRNLTDLDVEILHADLSDVDSLKKSFQGKAWIFHAAGYYPHNVFGMSGHVRTALLQTQNVIEAALGAGTERLIYTSSLTTIGKAPATRLADETLSYDLSFDDPHPYFRVKHLVEEAFRESFVKKDLPVVMVNPTGCFGPYELKARQNCLIPQLALQKIPAYVERPLNVVDTADVARGHCLAALKGRLGERYILGGHNLTTSVLLKQIGEAIGVKLPSLQLPLPLALAAAYAAETWGVLTRRQPLFPVLGLRFVQYGQHFSCARAATELGYTAGPMTPCFKKAMEWYQEIGYC